MLLCLLAQIKRGLVINLHDLMSDTLQLAAGAFILRKLYRDMFTWGQSSTLRLAIVLDEAHRLAKDVTLPKLMKEGRKKLSEKGQGSNIFVVIWVFRRVTTLPYSRPSSFFAGVWSYERLFRQLLSTVLR